MITVPPHGTYGTDDTEMIQDALDMLSANETLQFAGGNYWIGSGLVARDKQYIQIDGASSWIRTLGSFSGQSILDLSGSRGSKVRNLRLGAYTYTDRPEAGIVLGRTATGDGNNMVFDGVKTGGNFGVASLVNCSSENHLSVWCAYSNSVQGAAAVIDSNYDLWGLTGRPQERISNVCKAFIGCKIGSKGGACLSLCGSNTMVTIRDSFFSFGGLAGQCVKGHAPSGFLAGNSTRGLIIDGCRCEAGGTGDQSTSRLVFHDKDDGISGLSIRQPLRFTPHGDDEQKQPLAWVEIHDGLTDSEIRCTDREYAKYVLRITSGDFARCRVVVGSDALDIGLDVVEYDNMITVLCDE